MAVKATRALALSLDDGTRDKALEDLRDLCVEIEGEDADTDDKDKSAVKVAAATAFARAGETEEALETLGAGTSTEDLDACAAPIPGAKLSDHQRSVALIVHLYLTIRRPDLARKEFTRASKWAEDDLLLQHIEASIGLVTGADAYGNPHSYYAEQIAGSAPNPHLLTARGTTHLLRGNAREAAEDFAAAVKSTKNKRGEPDALAGSVAAARKQAEAEELLKYARNATAMSILTPSRRRLQQEYPEHPLVADLASKSELFDSLASNFTVPSLPEVVA